MPHGFIKYLEGKNYSPDTIGSYEKTLQLFHGFIKYKYQEDKEPFQISPSDIKSFMKKRLEEGINVTTVNKDLAILKTYFNFLWEKDKVPVDPAVKIKRERVKDLKSLDINYSNLLEIQPKVLKNPDYSPLRKSIYLLGMQGIKTSELSALKKEDVTIGPNQVELKLNNRALHLTGPESEHFIEFYHSTLFHTSDYIFTSKRQNDSSLCPIEPMTILTHLYRISEDYQLNVRLTLTSMRGAYTYYLYTKQRYSIEQISLMLGIEKISVVGALKNIQERSVNTKTS